MTIENLLIAVAILAASWFLKDSLISLIFGIKSAKLSKEVEEQKEKTDEAVTRANVSRESFIKRLQDYRSRRNSSDK